MALARGWTISILGHGALFAALLFAHSTLPPSLPDLNPPVPVEIVDLSEVQRVTEEPEPSAKAAPRETAQAEPEPEIAPEPTPPDPAPAPEPEPKPETKKPDQKKPDRDKALDQKLENLVDKSLQESDRKRLDVSELAKDLKRDIAKTAIRDTRATITLQQLMDAKVSACFNPPSGGADVKKITVQVQFRLNDAGQIVDGPRIVGRSGVTPANTAFADALARATLRAVIQCAPYELPQEFRSIWANQDFELNFDPSRLL